MKSAVIVFPGSNCDRDAKVALEDVTGGEVIMHWHGDIELPKVDLIVVPGGFSYGDYLRCGAMAAKSPVMREVKKRADDGIAVAGKNYWPVKELTGIFEPTAGVQDIGFMHNLSWVIFQMFCDFIA